MQRMRALVREHNVYRWAGEPDRRTVRGADRGGAAAGAHRPGAVRGAAGIFPWREAHGSPARLPGTTPSPPGLRKKGVRGMRPLFACWSDIAARLASSRMVALFLDFDGTLAAIQPRPELVRVHPDLRRTLGELASNPRLRLWVISARRRADIRARVRVPAARYLGLYGWERRCLPRPRPGPITCVKEALAATLPPLPAVWNEEQTVHPRGALPGAAPGGGSQHGCGERSPAPWTRGTAICGFRPANASGK